MKLIPENKRAQRIKINVFYLIMMTLVTVVVWTSVSVFLSYKKTTIDQDMSTLVKPLNPEINKQVLDNYASSRITPPDHFQITTVIRENNETTIKVIDPFLEANTGSPSAAINE